MDEWKVTSILQEKDIGSNRSACSFRTLRREGQTPDSGRHRLQAGHLRPAFPEPGASIRIERIGRDGCELQGASHEGTGRGPVRADLRGCTTLYAP